jgi:molybdopterin-guanine dinucleotide biosynthesis protein A
MINREMPGYILSGGKSSRFGSNKALAMYQDKPLLWHVKNGLKDVTSNVKLISKNKDMYIDVFAGEIMYDRFDVQTPLSGIVTALMDSETDCVIITACDMPFIIKDIYSLLLKNYVPDTVTLFYLDETFYPFPGLYPVSLLPFFRSCLSTKEYRFQKIFKKSAVTLLQEPQLKMSGLNVSLLDNINMPEDLEKQYSGSKKV